MRILVTNGGTHPEPAHLAAALVRHGHDVTYLTSATAPADGRVALLARVLRSTPPGRLLARRLLPEGLNRGNVVVRAAHWEALSQVVRRVAERRYSDVLDIRVRAFDRAAGRVARRGNYDVVIGQQTGAARAFAASGPASTRVLLYPLVHHRWMERVMATELHENPRWAPFLQGSTTTPASERVAAEELSLADRILVASSLTRRSLEEAGIPPERVLVQPLGWDPREFAPGAIETASSEAGEVSGLRVLFVGQLNQRKGLSHLIEAVARVPGASLRLVGPGSVEAIALIAQVGPDVEVVGPRSKPQLSGEFARADVFVLPSLAEGFGLTAMEAMGHGVATVVSRHTFAEDVLTDGVDGFIVPPGDVGALTRVLTRLADDPALRRRVAAAGKLTADRHSWEAYGEGAATLVEQAHRQVSAHD